MLLPDFMIMSSGNLCHHCILDEILVVSHISAIVRCCASDGASGDDVDCLCFVLIPGGLRHGVQESATELAALHFSCAVRIAGTQWILSF